MEKKIRYIILLTALISVFLFLAITGKPYPSYVNEINSYKEEYNQIEIEETNSEIILTYNNKETKLNFVMYGDSKYEAQSYIPFMLELASTMQANVRIIKYNFLGNINVVLHKPKENEIVISHGNGVEWLDVLSKKNTYILLGSTPPRKLKAENVMHIRASLDTVSDINKSLPNTTIRYEIINGNYSNYVFAPMHQKDAPSLITQKEQITKAIMYIQDFLEN